MQQLSIQQETLQEHFDKPELGYLYTQETARQEQTVETKEEEMEEPAEQSEEPAQSEESTKQSNKCPLGFQCDSCPFGKYKYSVTWLAVGAIAGGLYLYWMKKQ